MKSFIVYVWYRYISAIFRIFPIKNNRILFSNFFGKGYGESPKYIAEEILNNNKDYELIWLVKDKYYENIPQKIKQVKRGTLKELYYISTSKIWIDDCRKHHGIKKRKAQFYIQTWHSSLRLKKIEKDATDFLTKDYIKCAKADSKMIDIITCGCEFSYNTYKNSFWYNGKILMTGTPKFDIYFDSSQRKKIKDSILKRYNISKNKKIVLYAPTFRKNNDNFNGTIDFDKFNKIALDKNMIMFVRLHPNSKTTIKSNENIINVTDYPNIQDLIVSCNILVTDYSGCCFDALIADKACVLYVPDLNEYEKNERSLYFKFDELPFEKLLEEKELFNTIASDEMDYLKRNYKYFSEKVGLCEDGTSSKKIFSIIERVVNNEEI